MSLGWKTRYYSIFVINNYASRKFIHYLPHCHKPLIYLKCNVSSVFFFNTSLTLWSFIVEGTLIFECHVVPVGLDAAFFGQFLQFSLIIDGFLDVVVWHRGGIWNRKGYLNCLGYSMIYPTGGLILMLIFWG